MKHFSIILFLLFSSVCFAQNNVGFGTSGDILIGYKDKVTTTSIGYDFGYKFIPSLYIGVGPMVSGSFGNGDSSFSGGAYGKVRFTVPLDFNALPFIDGRVGYAYSFSASSGNMFYGAGLGIRFARNFCIGIYCNMSKSSWDVEESYIQRYEKKYNVIDKKYYTVPVYGRRTVKESKMNYIPSLLFSVMF